MKTSQPIWPTPDKYGYENAVKKAVRFPHKIRRQTCYE
jgi:hypothetical protein